MLLTSHGTSVQKWIAAFHLCQDHTLPNSVLTRNCSPHSLTPTHTHPHRDGGRFKRIPVFRGPSGGFGFAAPYEFDSLLTLVIYYASNTMEKHNAGLETNLKCPAFAEGGADHL